MSAPGAAPLPGVVVGLAALVVIRAAPQVRLDDLGVGPDLGRRAFGDLLAMVEDGHPVADPHDHAHVVLDEEDRQAEFAAQPADEIGQLAGLIGVHPGGRLVQQQQGRVGAEGPGDLQAALVAVRQVLAELIVLALEADERQELAGPLRGRDLLTAVARRREQRVDPGRLEPRVHPDEDVLERRHVREEPDVLERAAKPGHDHVVRAGAAEDAEAGEPALVGEGSGGTHHHDHQEDDDGHEDAQDDDRLGRADRGQQVGDERRDRGRDQPQDRLEPRPSEPWRSSARQGTRSARRTGRRSRR